VDGDVMGVMYVVLVVCVDGDELGVSGRWCPVCSWPSEKGVDLFDLKGNPQRAGRMGLAMGV
jgi:hypothetical protein